MSLDQQRIVFGDVNTAQLAARLEKPSRKVDVVLDTDCYNEIDDQFALAYMINAQDACNIRAICAAPFYSAPGSGRVIRSDSPGDGMERSYQEILKVLALAGRPDLEPLVYRGSDSYLTDERTPVPSPAADRLVALAREYSADNQLYIVAIGAITNVASALLLDPSMRERVVVVFLGGHGHHIGTCTDFNVAQDVAAARVVFGSGVPLVQVPCLGVVSEFRFTKVELESLFRGKNALCDYLIDNTYAYARDKFSYEGWSKPLWDVAAVAWLMPGDFMRDRLTPSPVPLKEGIYGIQPDRHPIRYVYYVNKDELTRDLVRRLA